LNKQLQTLIKVFLFFGLGSVILYFVYARQNKLYEAKCALDGILPEDCSLLNKLWTDITGANLGILVIILGFFMISNISRAIRWQMMLEPLGKKPRFLNALGAIMAAYLTNLGVPRSGEIVRAGIISKYEDIPLEKAIGTVVLDRLVDVISLLIVILLAFILSFDHMSGYFSENFDFMSKIQQFIYNPLFIAGIMITGLLSGLLVYFNWSKIAASYIGQKFIKIISGFLDGIKTIFKLKNPLMFLFHSFVIWLMYYLMTYVCFSAYEPTSHLGPVAGLVVFVFGSLGVVFPAPGGMGSYQFLVGESLGFFGINAADAFSFSNIVFFSIQIFCNILFGVLSFILLPIINKKGK
jgi:uncharacterized protein (TIRG00374 family)